MKDFQKLDVWQRSRRLTISVYRATEKFPREELFGITNQIRRATVSIAANIAEGSSRGSEADIAPFIQIAIGSASETECLLILASDLGYIPEDNFATLQQELIQIRKMLIALLKAFRIPQASKAVAQGSTLKAQSSTP